MVHERHPSRHAVLSALGANAAEVVTKLIGFAITGSIALLAETLHSVADTGNQMLLLIGARKARQSPTADMPFGRGREQYFWAFVVGLVLFGLGGVVSIIEGTRSLIGGGHGVDHPLVAIILVLIGAIFEGCSLRVGTRTARRVLPDGGSMWARLRQSRNPDVTVVVFEDTAALAGLALAFVGVTASAFTGNGAYDAVATIAIGLLLCGVAVILSGTMHALLIGAPAVRGDIRTLEAAITGTEGVMRILNLRTEHIGPDDLLVCVKVEIDPCCDLSSAIAAINEVERRVHAAVPATLTCYVEPDRFDPDRSAAPWT